MASRQRLNNAKDKTPLRGGASHRHRARILLFVTAAWAIVLVCTCVHGWTLELAAPDLGSHRAYDVLITRRSDTYYPRTYRAVLATDGRRCRIAFYWLDPAEEIEPTDALAFSDFLFDADRVWYWHHKDKRTHISALEPRSSDQGVRLPTGKGFEPILGSILTLIVHNRIPVANWEETMEASRFFQGVRGHDCLKHAAKPPPEAASTDALVFAWAKGDGAILDRLPFGRAYCRETDQEGNVVWRMSKATVAMEKARVTAKPMPLRNMRGWSEIGDPNTLGRWSAVPQAYRRYWALRDRSISLRRKPNLREAQQLYADIGSALRGALPEDLKSPLEELLFRAALHTGSDEAMRSSACQYFSTYVRLGQEPVERIVIELGRIGRELRARWPEDRTRDFICPLLKSIVDPTVFADPEFVSEDVLEWIHTQGPTWSWYEQVVRESVQEATGTTGQSPVHIGRVSAEPKSPTIFGDSEPNDDSTPADGRVRE